MRVGQKTIGSIIMFILGPLITIASFNHFFGANIPYTPTTWFLAFLVGLLAVLMFLGLFLLSIVGFVFLKGLPGLIIIGAAIVSLPVLIILSFNFIMATNVPVTFESYVIVGLVMVATAVLSGMLKGKGKF